MQRESSVSDCLVHGVEWEEGLGSEEEVVPTMITAN